MEKLPFTWLKVNRFTNLAECVERFILSFAIWIPGLGTFDRSCSGTAANTFWSATNVCGRQHEQDLRGACQCYGLCRLVQFLNPKPASNLNYVICLQVVLLEWLSSSHIYFVLVRFILFQKALWCEVYVDAWELECKGLSSSSISVGTTLICINLCWLCIFEPCLGPF